MNWPLDSSPKVLILAIWAKSRDILRQIVIFFFLACDFLEVEASVKFASVLHFVACFVDGGRLEDATDDLFASLLDLSVVGDLVVDVREAEVTCFADLGVAGDRVGKVTDDLFADLVNLGVRGGRTGEASDGLFTTRFDPGVAGGRVGEAPDDLFSKLVDMCG